MCMRALKRERARCVSQPGCGAPQPPPRSRRSRTTPPIPRMVGTTAEARTRPPQWLCAPAALKDRPRAVFARCWLRAAGAGTLAIRIAYCGANRQSHLPGAPLPLISAPSTTRAKGSFPGRPPQPATRPPWPLRLAGLPAVAVCCGQRVKREHRVCVGAAGTHLGRHPDGLHDLPLACAAALRKPRVPADAVRALRDVRNGNCDQLLGLLRKRAVCEHLAAERLKGIMGRRRGPLTALSKLASSRLAGG